jgi:hypothetical protein
VTLLVPLQGPRELFVHVCVLVSLFSSLVMVTACSFYSLKEVQGYRILVRGVTLVREGAPRPREGLIRWRHGLHYGGMALIVLTLLLPA